MTGVGRNWVISQAVPTLPSQIPILDARLANQTARKIGTASGDHDEGVLRSAKDGPLSVIGNLSGLLSSTKYG
jgi:hypothetical protein